MLAFRVLRDFGWNGWQYVARSNDECRCQCWHRKRDLKITCTKQTYTDCACRKVNCYCPCVKDSARRAGDIWIMPEGRPEIDRMVRLKYAVYDSTIDPDALLRLPEYSRLQTAFVAGYDSPG